MTITVSTDGSALGNPNGPMGWAWADHEPAAGGKPGHEHAGDCDAGGATNGTNQIGELCAVLEALRAHPGSEDLVIETDSQYAINCSTKWVQGWKRNGWKTADKKPVKNADLWQLLDSAQSTHQIDWRWVKGHAGHEFNERADALANRGVETALAGR
ncbi:ribonuclease H family protein [Rivihabitans pingtungensis]|uniref:ribonuclease H family protein n=1 Tax=Rivihabitans pingtungensis TaxID=1054498 RepID=UPI0023F30665|nr:ribonuclease H [Rivihabitans pingtungensis]